MDKVYVLITGEYSDWHIEGFAETEEEAINICAKKNANMARCDDEWYYEEADKIRFDDAPVKLAYCFTVYFHDGGTRTWTMNENIGMNFFSSDDKRLERMSEEVTISGDLTHSASCTVILDENSPGKAKKIAQDRLYKKLAEVELEYMDTLPPKYLYLAYFERDDEKKMWALSDKSHMEVTNRLDERLSKKSIGRFDLGLDGEKRTILVKTVMDKNDEGKAIRISKERFAAFLDKQKNTDIPWLNGTIEED